ncbi:Growth arrest-specific protein 2 [Amphibalanus amphitrite]|uniref:Growth arrest-specific protein 2 n=1 Tax=Amphibalanus amphitrite TaxID=1232801 RepID=A0A6A4VSY3_AMPAM|nr:Growth arrest-specific protein 2 [Amphibalanus amphitrite]
MYSSRQRDAWLCTDHIDVNNYMSVLDNGILLCRLAKIIADRAAHTHTLTMPPPTFKFRCWDRARPGTFFARDNVFNFLQFCKLVGCQENFLFETDGLAPRGVLLCLLELGRHTSTYVEPPTLVRLEQEIEEQERMAAVREGSDSGYSDTNQERERSAERDVLDARSPRPTSLIPVRRRKSGSQRRGGTTSMPASALTSPAHHRSTPRLSVAGAPSGACTPSRIPRPQGGRAHLVRVKMALHNSGAGASTGGVLTTEERTQQLRERLHQLEMREANSSTPRRPHARASTPASSSSVASTPTCRTPTHGHLSSSGENSLLDKKVQEMVEESAAGCKCRTNCMAEVQLRRVAEGQYNVAGRTVFIRLLKGRHVMVRVGGGWDTLEHFLSRHDPCQSATLPGSLATGDSDTTEMFLRLPATPRTRCQVPSNG